MKSGISGALLQPNSYYRLFGSAACAWSFPDWPISYDRRICVTLGQWLKTPYADGIASIVIGLILL
jgi:hypothetical protein